MTPVVIAVFIFVYLGMILGELPGLALDRTGIALLGAIFFMAAGYASPREAWDAVDVPTIALLLGLMVVSAQFRLGGFYTEITRRIAGGSAPPPVLLALIIAVTGILSALLANDVVCLAVAPVLIEACAKKGLNPVPFLIGLACAANVGSAATLIGNPQNMLIGQVLGLSFAGYLLMAALPSLFGLAAVWAVLAVQYRSRFRLAMAAPEVAAPAFNPWQTGKGLFVILVLVIGFLFSPWPRELLAMAGAGLLLTSRRLASRDILNLVDWQLLVLFIGLFVVNHVLESSGLLALIMERLARAGIDPAQPAGLFAITVVLSNLVSNVPATMLLLPSAQHPLAGPILALASTLAGNLFIVGSIANIIVIDQAKKLGVKISWREHARTGVPVTIITLALAAAWLALISRLG